MTQYPSRADLDCRPFIEIQMPCGSVYRLTTTNARKIRDELDASLKNLAIMDVCPKCGAEAREPYTNGAHRRWKCGSEKPHTTADEKSQFYQSLDCREKEDSIACIPMIGTLSAGSVEPSHKRYRVTGPPEHKTLNAGDVVVMTQTPTLQNMLVRESDLTLHHLTDEYDQNVHLVEVKR